MNAFRIVIASLAIIAGCAPPHALTPLADSCWFQLEPGTVSMFAIDASGDILVVHGDDAAVKLTRLHTDGSVAWEVPIAPAARRYDAIALDPAGDVLVTGSSNYPPDASPGGHLPGCFVAKGSGADGHSIWSTTFTGTGAQLCRGITSDRAGDVYITGFFAGTLDAPNGPLTSRGMSDILVARLSATDGTPRWVRQIGGRGDDIARVIVIDHHGDVIVGGNFSQGVAPQDGTIELAGTMTSAGDADGFLAKLGADGEPVWSRGFGDVGWDIVKSIAVDPEDNLYLSGAWMRPQDFHGELPFLTGVMDGLLARYSRTGDLQWRHVFPGGGSQAHHLARDRRGRLWVIGHFKSTVDIAGRHLEGMGTSSAYLASLTPAGVVTSAAVLGAPAAQYGYGVESGPDGALVVTGTAKGTGRYCGRDRTASAEGEHFLGRLGAP